MTNTPEKTARQPLPQLGWTTSAYADADVARCIEEFKDLSVRGCELGMITLHMEHVYANREDMDANKPESWARYDRLIEGLTRHCPWLAIRIHLGYQAKTIIRHALDKGKTPIFGLQDMMKDQWGRRACLQYHEGPGCFAIPEIRDRLVDFVGRVVKRYQHLSHRMHWISVTMSTCQESEYPHGNHSFVKRDFDEEFIKALNVGNPTATALAKEDQWPGEGEWATRFDYHPAQIPAFQGYLMLKYRTIQELNAAWGSKHSDWQQIQAPRIDFPDITPSCFEDWRLMFKTRPGVDWYRYLHESMKDFQLRCRSAIRKTRSDIPFCSEFGSCTDNLSLMRGNYDIPDLSGWVDILKTGQGGLQWNGERSIDADLTRPNFRGDRHMEVNENDVPTQTHPAITDPAQVKNAMLEMAKWVFRQGISCVPLIGRKGSPYYEKTLEVAEELRRFVDTPYERINVAGHVDTSVEELITNYQGVWQRWHEASRPLDSLMDRIDVRIL
jgi:hypothetical protein